MVVVNPNRPMSIEDFAAIYTANGTSPEENGRQIFHNAPTAAKSYMDQQWGRMGINESPETFFARAVARSPVAAPSSPSEPGPIPTAWPTFRNEAERNIAIETGAYDPQFASPLKRAEYEILSKARLANNAEASAAAIANTPVVADPTKNPTAFVNQVLAGDQFGDVKKVLASRNGLPSGQSLGPGLKPYIPKGGYGTSSPDYALSSPLDTELVSDPQFIELQRRDPARAAFVYQRLTGRDYKTDLGRHTKIGEEQFKTGYDYAKRAIFDGAQYDSRTGKWKVWSNAMPEGDGFSFNAPRATRMLVDANEAQNAALNQHYQNVTRMPLSKYKAPPPLDQTTLQQLQSDPVMSSAISAVEAKLGRKLDSREQLVTAQKAMFDQSQTDQVPTWAKAVGAFGHGTANLMNSIVDLPPGLVNDALDLSEWAGIPTTEKRMGSWANWLSNHSPF